MKNSLFSIRNIAILLFALAVGYYLIFQPDTPISEDVKNRDIKVYSIKITPKDYEKPPSIETTQNCNETPSPCLTMERDSSEFDISFCMTCETSTVGTISNPEATLGFIHTPTPTFLQRNTPPPSQLTCNGSGYRPAYTVKFDPKLGNNPNDRVTIRFTAQNPSGSPIDTTFSFSICP